MKNWFKYNNTEEKGRIALLFLFWVVFIAVLTKHYWWPNGEVNNNNTRLYMEYLDTLLVKENPVFKEESVEVAFNPQKFNPNTISKRKLLSFGLDAKAVNSIVAYRNSGAVYKIQSDIKKAFGVDEILFKKLQPFILLPEKFEKEMQPENTFVFKEDKLPQIELNSVDSTTLTQFKGIGPAFASRIVKYRSALGGFISLNQLYEVYGIDSSVVQTVLKNATLQEAIPTKLNFNSENFKEILSHPYISYKQAQAILNYREQHGNYSTAEDLYPIIILDSAFVLKISPYFGAK